MATIHLRTRRKAKASAAYASACVYFAAGTALLDERNWGSQYELMFKLWLEGTGGVSPGFQPVSTLGTDHQWRRGL